MFEFDLQGREKEKTGFCVLGPDSEKGRTFRVVAKVGDQEYDVGTFTIPHGTSG
jgi:hypothetical protein